MANPLMPLFGKITKGKTKYFLVAITEHDKNSVAKIADLSTKTVSTLVKNHSTGHVTQYISNNPKRVGKALKTVAKLTMS